MYIESIPHRENKMFIEITPHRENSGNWKYTIKEAPILLNPSFIVKVMPIENHEGFFFIYLTNSNYGIAVKTEDYEKIKQFKKG